MSSYESLNTDFSRWAQAAGAGVVGLVTAGVWAFAEGTFWFIAPDFILILASAFVPPAWRRLVAAALVGSLLGGMVCWVLNSYWLEDMGRVLHATPFVTQRMIDTIDGWYTHHGPPSVFFQSFSFMQFKIWTHLAVRHGFDPVVYFMIVMFSRAVRFTAVAWIGSVVGRRMQTILARHAIALTAGYAILFVVMLLVMERR
jgi:membrane protein YqaA with SNARE-associated domain